MVQLQFDAGIEKINSKHIILLPGNISKMLSSRGMTMIKGVINGMDFETPLEPDGMGSHWFSIDTESIINKTTGTVSVIAEEMDVWNEPEIPIDIRNALINTGLEEQWNGISTKARWEWIRWIRFTKNPETRKRRIETACSMLGQGKKRPCCFDHSRCTDMSVSKNGVLIGLIKSQI